MDTLETLTIDENYAPPLPGRMKLADGRVLCLLSETSFQLTDSSGKHLQYGPIEHIEYEPSLINQYRKLQTVRPVK